MQGRVQDDVSKMKRLQPKHRQKKRRRRRVPTEKSHSVTNSECQCKYRGSYVFLPNKLEGSSLLVSGEEKEKKKERLRGPQRTSNDRMNTNACSIKKRSFIIFQNRGELKKKVKRIISTPRRSSTRHSSQQSPRTYSKFPKNV